MDQQVEQAIAQHVSGTTIASPSSLPLQSALDLEGLWQSCIEALEDVLPTATGCEFYFDFDGFKPRRALQHIRNSNRPGYTPPVSLSVAAPFLCKYPHKKLYSYSQIVCADPNAAQRRQQQDADGEWDEFVQSAFWDQDRLEAVLSVAWRHDQGQCAQRMQRVTKALHGLYHDLETGLRRLRQLEQERLKYRSLERVLKQMSSALMLVGLDGNTLFSNSLAQRLSARWNDALDGAPMRLPQDLDGMVEDACAEHEHGTIADSPSCVIAHPHDQTLALKVRMHWETTGLHSLPCYVLELINLDQTRPPDALAEAAISEMALRALKQLSPRERRVATLVAQGLRNEQIAQELARSRRTIEFQIGSIFRKLDVSSRVQLARLLN